MTEKTNNKTSSTNEFGSKATSGFTDSLSQLPENLSCQQQRQLTVHQDMTVNQRFHHL